MPIQGGGRYDEEHETGLSHGGAAASLPDVLE
jgi:hypothetical protein